jgi:hypothetical protein
VVDKPSTSISLSVSVILRPPAVLPPRLPGHLPSPSARRPLPPAGSVSLLLPICPVAFSLPFLSTGLLSSPLPLSPPRRLPPTTPCSSSSALPLLPVLPLPSPLSISLFVYFGDIDYRLNSQPPSTPLSPPTPLIHSLWHPRLPPLGPACCLVACTVSHRCSSLQRQYSSRQLRSAVQQAVVYEDGIQGCRRAATTSIWPSALDYPECILRRAF